MGRPSVILTAVSIVAAAGCAQYVQSAESSLSGVVASAIDAQTLGDHVFTRVNLEQTTQGYLIESGNLSIAGEKVDGSLVAVKGLDGAVTAIVDRPGKRGILLIDKAGKQRFLPESAYDYLKSDTVVGAVVPHTDVKTPSNNDVIDVVTQFSVKAVTVLLSDPVAFSLAQLETANLGLRNSEVEGVRLNLAGIRFSPNDYPVDGPGLNDLRDEVRPLRGLYHNDIFVGYSDNSPYAGMAYAPGDVSINGIHYPLAFRHEVGHNAGGDHCNDAGKDNYKFGYDNGSGSNTFLCGNNVPYYSNTRVRIDGKPLGDARTADMARLWREQSGRMSGYQPAFDGYRLVYADFQSADLLIDTTGSGRTHVGVVALSNDEGPTTLVDGGEGETLLTATLKDAEGREHAVKFRATRQVIGCTASTFMNSYRLCGNDDAGSITLKLHRIYKDNGSLPRGVYNGTLQLKVLDHDDPTWSRDILVSLAVNKLL